jgi:hypothetical protein
MRRNLAMGEAQFPEDVQNALKSLETEVIHSEEHCHENYLVRRFGATGIS